MKKLYFLLLLLIPTGLLYSQEGGFKWIRSVNQQTVRPYQFGLSAFFENGKWGFLNTDGEVSIKAQFDEVFDFFEGRAIVRIGEEWGVIDIYNNFIFTCSYKSIEPFSDGIALASEENRYCYLYADGTKRALPAKHTFGSYSSGLAKVKSNGKWGYIDIRGNFVIDPKYDEAGDFNGDYAIVKRKQEQFLITKKGSKKTPPLPINETFQVFDKGIAFVKYNDSYSLLAEDLTTIPLQFKDIRPIKEGAIYAKGSDDNLHFLDSKGKIFISLPGFDAAGDFSDGKAWVMKKGKYGYIDKNGILVIDTLFSYASDFSNGLAYVAAAGRQGVISQAYSNETFPNLTISGIKLIDANDNGKVEAEERFKVELTITNKGNDILRDSYITIGGNPEQSAWFSFDKIRLSVGSMEPNQSKVIEFEGVSNTELLSEEIQLNFKGEANNLFASVSAPFTFTATGINACKPLMTNYWIHTADHSPLSPGVATYLELTVKNEGTDIAKDVIVNLKWPEGVVPKEESLKIGTLNPDQERTVKTSFTITNSYENNFSIVASLSEFTKKKNDVKYLAFETGKLNSSTNLITGVVSYQTVAMATPGGNQIPAAPAPTQKKRSELLDGLSQIRATNPDRYALVIGNEDYNSLKTDVVYEPNVDFAEQDAKTFADFAKKILGVPEQNIILLTNATYAQMNQNITKITRMSKASPGKMEIFVYYAGHGQIDGDSKETYLIPVDVSTTSPTAGIKLEKFYSALSECSAKKTMVFLDACYSGVGRGIVIRPKETPIKGNLLIMTASSSTQRSMPYQEKGHGMFTYFLLKSLKDSQGEITIGKLFEQVRADVQSKSIWVNNMEQTPELINGPEIAKDWKNWNL